MGDGVDRRGREKGLEGKGVGEGVGRRGWEREKGWEEG